MSNYLANLAARSLGHMPVAQPRLASRFEPVAAGPSPVAAPPPEADALVEPIGRPPVAATQQAFTTIDREADSMRAFDQSDRPEPRREHREVKDLREASAPPTPKAAPRPAPEVPIAIVQRVADPKPPAPTRRDAVASPRIEVNPVARTLPAGNHEGHSIVRLPLADDSRWHQADQRLSALERRLRAPDRAREPALRTPRGESNVPRPALSDRPPQPPRIAHAAMDDARPHEAPAVQVTIGRIDVRAIVAPSSRPARRQAAPRLSLSLEQYLKQRSSR